ncbi:MAG: hypothetical protein ABWX93_04555 [Pseudoxanthomonas sp.]
MKPLSPFGRLLVASAAAIAVMWLLGFLGSLAAGASGLLSAADNSRTNPLSLLVTAIAMCVGGGIAGKRFIGVALGLMCLLWLGIVLVLLQIATPAQPDALAHILSYNGLQIALSMLAACAGAAVGAWLRMQRAARAA